ncbi:hypothetical protein HCA99_16815 [Listeria booriae]|uniref:hypothetical protein n=1 Tax=Listeria booriae TaxID=1552123 RepID=UPI00162AEA0C|nr:hypothetical protein [Listeria booriae]MBC2080895.1 hypothetical protein [Listeria booriae]
MKSQEMLSISFREYSNESLCIELIDSAFDVVLECTVETNAIDDFEDIREFSERKNDKIRGWHRQNLIVAVDWKNELVLKILKNRDIIQALPIYMEKDEDRILAFFMLTKYGIEQKCQIIDEYTYTRLTEKREGHVFYDSLYTDLIYKTSNGLTDFAVFYFNPDEAGLLYGQTKEKTPEGIRSYLESLMGQILYEYHGAPELIDQKLIRLSSRVVMATEFSQ